MEYIPLIFIPFFITSTIVNRKHVRAMQRLVDSYKNLAEAMETKATAFENLSITQKKLPDVYLGQNVITESNVGKSDDSAK